jgi:hypothetical protein
MEDQIKRRAYELWDADGRPDGRDQDYWFKAMAELAASALAATALAVKPRKRAARTKKAA